jgi:Fur family transcriptional regulator, ferric uptake regulator
MADAPSDAALHVLATLRALGERITTPRRALIELLAATDEHLSVDDITSRLHVLHPSIALSTVYRALETLEAMGLVERIHRGQGATFFHLARSHRHLECAVCGRLTDIPAHELDDLVARMRERYGFDLQPGRFALLGQCVEPCRGEQAS